MWLNDQPGSTAAKVLSLCGPPAPGLTPPSPVVSVQGGGDDRRAALASGKAEGISRVSSMAGADGPLVGRCLITDKAFVFGDDCSS